jgi:hypothetical protein
MKFTVFYQYGPKWFWPLLAIRPHSYIVVLHALTFHALRVAIPETDLWPHWRWPPAQ